MKTKTLVLIALFIGALVGCNSFNRTVNGDRSTRDETTGWGYWPPIGSVQEEEEADKKPAAAPKPAEVVTTGCPVYRLPALPRQPVIPYKEFQALSPKDVGGVDELERKHIQELHVYIVKLKSTIVASHAAYLMKCQKLLAK